MGFDLAKRNVLLLSLCQGLQMTGMIMTMTMIALVGHALAEDKSLATLPLALQFTATMLTTIPASLLMKRVGRRLGFIVGVSIGIAGATLSALAIVWGSFLLLSLAALAMGASNGFAQFYRFAAADAADGSFKARAISLVVAGGVVAAVIGPELSKFTSGWLDPFTFAGTYAAIAALWSFALPLLAALTMPRPTVAEQTETGRPLSVIVRQPVFVVAAMGGMVGYGVMSLVMTATPLAMVACGFRFDDAAFVIQWHALGMFVPSFFTGTLIQRFGVLTVMFVGAVILVLSVGVGLSGIAMPQFFSALVLLGVGWNFLYVGGSTLLTESYRPAERAKTQALNDFLVFSSTAASSFSSGALQHFFGWDGVNLGVLPLILVALGATIWLMLQRRAQVAAIG
jgi:MFS family permease